MSRRVEALQGEPLDALVWRVTGQGAGAVERVLLANPGLAVIARALPESTSVLIPDLPAMPTELPLLQLWD